MSHASIEKVRETINQLDTQIVKLLCEREKAVKEASTFKKSTDAVKAPDRVEKVIERVRHLAIEDGGNPAIIEKIYREMIAIFITMEMDEYNAPH